MNVNILDPIEMNKADNHDRFEALRGLPNKKARAEIRSGAYRGHTAGIDPGYIQGMS